MTISKVEDNYTFYKGKNPLFSERHAEFISASNMLDPETSSG
ncbi:hypothetical protein SAMN05878281_3566 [Salegentibacter salegens]|uniref:Uncharacterized protein n=1 Tax=Salegentibacter salegens TaxID=143223 RepID=A0A1M7P0F1_9FLAO|nr:hypothetical protein LY58_01608 [Salegentibacter salegens]SHN09414.1 hypothetical protein SAMN05878281_3566 [Salegentibacter salegens]